MLKLLLVVALCVNFASCDTLFFRPFGSWGAEEEKDPPNPTCPDKQGTCPQKSTCCKKQDGKYGCCPLPNAVCCSDLTHCCPQGFVCDLPTSTCVSGNLVIDWLQHIRPVQKSQPGQGLKQEPASRNSPGGNDVPCPRGKVVCPSGNTCCMLDQSYGCCPMAEAVCCTDHKHCCPKGYKCTSQSCSRTQGKGTAVWMNLVSGNQKVSKTSKVTSEKLNSKLHKNSKTVTGKKPLQEKHGKKAYDIDINEDDDNSKEDNIQNKKFINIKNKSNKKTNPGSDVQEVVKPKPVSKKAKENLNVKKDIGNKDDSKSKKVQQERAQHKQISKPEAKNTKVNASVKFAKNKSKTLKNQELNTKNTPEKKLKPNPSKQKIFATKPEPISTTPKVKSTVSKHQKSTTAQSTNVKVPVSKFVQSSGKKTESKLQGKTSVTKAETKKKSDNHKALKNQPQKISESLKQQVPVSKKQSNKPFSKEQQNPKAAPVITQSIKPRNVIPKIGAIRPEVNVNIKPQKPSQALPKKPSVKKVPENNPPAESESSVLDLDFVPTGVKKLINKIGMMSANVKKALVDSLLESEINTADHPEEHSKEKQDNKKKIPGTKSKKVAKTQENDGKLKQQKPSKQSTVSTNSKISMKPNVNIPAKGMPKKVPIKEGNQKASKTVIKPSVKSNVQFKTSDKAIKQSGKMSNEALKQITRKISREKNQKVVKSDNLSKHQKLNKQQSKENFLPSKTKVPIVPMGQTKAPLPKPGQQVRTKPAPSRVTKPVAKDVPAQKTTQSIGIKTKVKSNVIEGIPSANLKALKLQLLQRQQQALLKQQQIKHQQQILKKPEKIKQTKSDLKPSVKHSVVKPKEHVNVPKSNNIPKAKANIV